MVVVQRTLLRVRHGAHEANGRRTIGDHGPEPGRLSLRPRHRQGPEFLAHMRALIGYDLYDRLRAVQTI